MKKIGLYIHIPFCKSKCAYCAFTSFKCDNATMSRYTDALSREIAYNLNSDYAIDTIYIGGGTPSILDIEDIDKIVSTVKANALWIPREFTIECNPESINETKLQEYKKLGVTRISMGVQSLNDSILKTIGRIHNSDVAISKAKMVRSYDVDLSVDMILGLPGADNNDIAHFIDTFASIGVQHISAYSLSVEPDTRLDRMVNCGIVSLPTEDDTVDQYEYAYNKLNACGYHRYEVSNFAIDGHESIHNNKYWQMDDYIGVGLASHSFINGVRYHNTSDINEYITSISSNGTVHAIDENLSLRDRVEETVMLGLRLEKGVSLNTLDELVKGDFVSMNETNIDRVRAYINISNGRLSIKPEYMNVMNSIIVDLLE